MALAAGTRLGPYEILAPIGAGGMGEVYRARDTKLDRAVAIKVLPSALAQDPERLARFEREAKVLAALNHPNIAQIYGVEQGALVMELVEGENLSGPVPLATALDYAHQIADALEAAHERGIVHRDLKPANIKVTPQGVVKVLDFGLAAVMQNSVPPDSNATQSPTLTLGATQMGVLLGTAAYMSPEQARGKPVDKRADIWAFGVVLFEMVTGRRLFQGEDISHTLAAVIMKEPDFEGVPAQIQHVLKRCLEKDPRKRLRDISGVELLLEQTRTPDPQPLAPSTLRAVRTARIAVCVAAAAVLSLVAIAFVHFRERPTVAEVIRFQIPTPNSGDFANTPPALSPDGRTLAFVVFGANGRRQIWIRSLDTLEARSLPGTDDTAGYLIWSPDSRSIAFTLPPPVLKLKKVDIAGGPAQTLCDISDPALGAWNREGVIVFRFRTGLIRVSAAGGSCTPVTLLDAKRGEVRHTTPSFLPDQKHFVYLRVYAKPEDSGIYVGSLDAKPEQQSAQRILAGTSSAVYAPSQDSAGGYLLFVREASLMAQPFDPQRFRFTGEAVPIAEQVGVATGSDVGLFSVSNRGALAYRTGGTTGNFQLVWFDRTGKRIGVASEPGGYNTLSLSPDGTRVAFQRAHAQGGGSDIWVQELSRGASTRLTADAARDWLPVWSPDSSQIVFGSQRDGIDNLYQKPANGAGDETPVLKTEANKLPQDWSRDGRYLVYSTNDRKNLFDLWVLPLQGERKPKLFVGTQFRESQARFSPDGRFIAYTSDSTGRYEIYVRPFSPDGNVAGLWPISKDGGTQPAWRRDGKELFFISADSKMVAVPVTTTPTFKAGIPEALLTAPIFGGGAVGNVKRWDTLDGKRFLINSVTTETGSAPISIVLNWQAGLKK